MTAKTQWEYFQRNCELIGIELNKGIASYLLKLPIPMSYEAWWHLHKIKGDYDD